MSIRMNPGDTRGPVPALRGTFVTDWHVLCRDPHVPLQDEDIACLKEDLGLTCVRYGFLGWLLSDEDQEIYHEEGFGRLEQMLSYCADDDLHCIVDLDDAPYR